VLLNDTSYSKKKKSKLAHVATLLTCILEVPGSHFDRHTVWCPVYISERAQWMVSCGLLNTSHKKNSYLSASPHFATYIVQQPRHLSYRGTRFSVPSWQTSVPWFINHLATNVSFSWSPLTPRAGKRWRSFGEEFSSHNHGPCTTVSSTHETIHL